MTPPALPPSLDPENYEMDDDGLPREKVGPWVRDKHARLEKYVGISRSVRSKFVGTGKAGATFIDLFAGSGRARIRDEVTVVDGSPLVAWKESTRGKASFTELHIADTEPVLLDAAEKRLRRADAPVFGERGRAAETVDKIVSKLNPYGLHFAFLDPYNLGALPFDVIRKLARMERMDILIHVSVQDLQRNLHIYRAQNPSALDAFAPGWRDYVGDTQVQSTVRAKILEHWRGLIRGERMQTAEALELVTGTENQRLYWLSFAARHERALEFWEKIRDSGPERQLGLI